MNSSNPNTQSRAISDPEENPKIPSRISGEKDDRTKKEEPKKDEMTINQAMEGAVIIGAEENPYYEGLQISQLEVRKCKIFDNNLRIIKLNS